MSAARTTRTPRTPPISAREARRLARAREHLCDAIERLMALLDALDGDPDLEPSLGSLDSVWPRLVAWDRDHSTCQLGWGLGSRDDREDDVDCHEGEGEPERSVAIKLVRTQRLPQVA